MKEKILKHRILIYILIILFVSCLICIPLLKDNLNVYYDDGVQHIARAIGTADSIKESKFIPNVISSFSNSYGYSWNLFYGPLSAYAIVLINTLAKNYIVSYKIVCFICMFLSGFFMYKTLKEITKNKDAAVLASILYMSFPYHLTDLYTRNALGEYMSFIFIPLVFLGLYNLFYGEERKHYYIAIGASGLILTHNLSTIMVAVFALCYVIFYLEKLNNPKIKKVLIINIIFILLLTSFYWMPLVQTMFSAQYQVYEDGMMSTSEQTAGHGLKIKQLFVTMNDGSYVFELGPHILIMLGLSVMAFRLVDPEVREQYLFFLIFGLITLWMSTKYFPWKFLPDMFSMIQFPWRMLMLSAFFLSAVCAINMNTIIKKFNIKDVLVISTISILYILAFYNTVTNFDENRIADIENVDKGYVSGREYEVVAGMGKGEYLPTKAYKNRFYIASREQGIYVLEGKAVIENEKKEGSHYTADIKTLDAEYTIFELPYIYYPGYEVRLDGVLVESFETENGFLGFAVGSNDTNDLEVSYTGTTMMNISLLLSFVSFIGFGIYIYKKR